MPLVSFKMCDFQEMQQEIAAMVVEAAVADYLITDENGDDRYTEEAQELFNISYDMAEEMLDRFKIVPNR